MKTATRKPPATAEAAVPLRPLLADLIVLSLHAKQAHWNVTGPQFRPLHEQFDAIATEARDAYDLVAERLLALGEPADGRMAALLERSGLEEMPAGALPGPKAVGLLLDRVEGVAARAREGIAALGESDPVTQDMVLGIVEGLEKQAWMLRSQRA
jgi:starvation-inducible DNA-binding protein